MARIDTYQQSVPLQAPATPSPQLSTAFSDELQRLGGSVQDAASSLIQRQNQKDEFAAQNGYRKLKLDLANELSNRAQQMPEGGEGFHDAFMSQVFQPKRDAFLAGIKSPELRKQFETVLADGSGSDATDWSIQAATTQRDESYRWYKQEISATHEQLATAVGMDPDRYDQYLADGQQLIDSSGLPTPEKALLKTQWRTMAQTALLNGLLGKDDQAVLRKLGVDPRQLSPTTQFEVLSRAVQWQESRDNPNAVSGKGAVGLMQVMPGTARDIAKMLGDESFPTGAPDAAVRAYMSNPYVNKMYGEAYLRQQLKTFAGARDPIAAALVAYNAGPGVAKKWVESGYDDKVLPAETRKYRDTIMETLKSPVALGNPSDVVFKTRDGTPLQTNDDLRDRVASAYATLGLDTVLVNSDTRTPEENSAVGGAEHSQHLSGNALDLNVKGKTIAEKIELIKALSAAGVTGIGIYGDAIHADLGGRRAWGPDYHFTSVPKWASAVIAEHLNGTTPPPRAVDAQMAGIPYDLRQQFISKADQNIAAQAALATKASATDKVRLDLAMNNEIALVRATGQGSGTFDETNISTVLGEDDYVKFMHEREVAQQTYTATAGINVMMPEDMEQRYNDYTPDPASPNFADQQKVQAAVAKEIERITTLRAKHPDDAAGEDPEVQAAWAVIEKQVIAGGDPEPKAAQDFVRTMLEKQAEYGIKPEARAPIPRSWAIQIGKALTRVPEIKPGLDSKARGTAMEEQRANIISQYEGLQKVFGDYTDEVILYALTEYKGLPTPVATMLSAYMKSIAMGGDPLHLNHDKAADQGQVESFGFVIPPTPFTPMIVLGGGGTSAGGHEGGLTPEQQLRQVENAASDAAAQ